MAENIESNSKGVLVLFQLFIAGEWGSGRLLRFDATVDLPGRTPRLGWPNTIKSRRLCLLRSHAMHNM